MKTQVLLLIDYFFWIGKRYILIDFVIKKTILVRFEYWEFFVSFFILKKFGALQKKQNQKPESNAAI